MGHIKTPQGSKLAGIFIYLFIITGKQDMHKIWERLILLLIEISYQEPYNSLKLPAILSLSLHVVVTIKLKIK